MLNFQRAGSDQSHDGAEPEGVKPDESLESTKTDGEGPDSTKLDDADGKDIGLDSSDSRTGSQGKWKKMRKYTVKHGAGEVHHNGERYGAGDKIELTDAEALKIAHALKEGDELKVKAGNG